MRFYRGSQYNITTLQHYNIPQFTNTWYSVPLHNLYLIYAFEKIKIFITCAFLSDEKREIVSGGISPEMNCSALRREDSQHNKMIDYQLSNTDTQTDRHTDRQTDWQIDRYTDTHTQTDTEVPIGLREQISVHRTELVPYRTCLLKNITYVITTFSTK